MLVKLTGNLESGNCCVAISDYERLENCKANVHLPGKQLA